MTQDTAATLGGKNRYRRWLLAAGMLISAVSVVYLVRYAIHHGAGLRGLHLGAGAIAWGAVACALYAAALLATALAWLAAVRACRDPAPAARLVGIALVSQVAKYAPGNIAQHVGRAMLATGRGMSLAVVTRSTVFELASAVIAGAVVVIVGGWIASLSGVSMLSSVPAPSYWFLGLGLAGALVAVAAMIAPRLILVKDSLSLARRPAAVTLLLHIVSAALAGFSFYAVTVALGGTAVKPAFCVALFSMAWLLGFVTPGAPAGLGVREAVLVIGLSGSLGAMSFPAAVMHRLVTALADGLMALVGALVLKASGGRP